MCVHVSAVLFDTSKNMLLKIYIYFASSENVDRASTNLKHWSDQTRFSGNNNNNNNNKSLFLNPDMFYSQICKGIFPNWNALLTPVSGQQEVGCIPIFPPALFHTAHIELSDIQRIWPTTTRISIIHLLCIYY